MFTDDELSRIIAVLHDPSDETLPPLSIAQSTFFFRRAREMKEQYPAMPDDVAKMLAAATMALSVLMRSAIAINPGNHGRGVTDLLISMMGLMRSEMAAIGDTDEDGREAMRRFDEKILRFVFDFYEPMAKLIQRPADEPPPASH